MKALSLVRRIPVVLGLCLVVAVASIASAQTDPHIGTWKLNLEKLGATGPGQPSGTVTVTYEGDAVEQTILMLGDVDGKPINAEKETVTITIDGKEHPSSDPAYDTTLWKRIDANSYQMTRKKDGKVVQSGMSVVSMDGGDVPIAVEI